MRRLVLPQQVKATPVPWTLALQLSPVHATIGAALSPGTQHKHKCRNDAAAYSVPASIRISSVPVAPNCIIIKNVTRQLRRLSPLHSLQRVDGGSRSKVS